MQRDWFQTTMIDQMSRMDEESSVFIHRAATHESKAVRLLLKRSRIGRDVAPPLSQLWTATLHNQVVGTAGLELIHPVAVLHSVAVEKQLRHRGIGLQLVTRCLEEAGRQGAETAALVTMFWNVNFFRRAGFESISRKELPWELRRHPLFSAAKYRYTIPMFLKLGK